MPPLDFRSKPACRQPQVFRPKRIQQHRLVEGPEFWCRIQHRNRRVIFSLGTTDPKAARVMAARLYHRSGRVRWALLQQGRGLRFHPGK
jgi:hypothetical protein